MIGEEDPKMLKGYRHLRRIMDRLDRLSAPEKVAQAARIKAAQCRLLSIVRIVRQRHPHPESVSEHTFFVLLRDREEQAAKKKAQG